MQRRPPLHLRVGRISQPASCLTVGKRYTSDVASPSAPASTPPQAQGPRRRAVPVASSLGNISIGNKWSKPTFTKPALKIDPDPAPAPGWTPSTEPPVQGTFASRLAKLAKLDTKPAQSFPKKHSSPPATPKVYKPRAEWENDAQADNGGLEIEWGQHSQAGRGSNRGGRRGQSDETDPASRGGSSGRAFGGSRRVLPER
ncbi:hypothetical protein JAAARDRAFT_75705 [Jaapia argillacea MUCL 33604]|uniref:Uncharacterized protein n=1 Tax=Jaapia argillacea MUCL 33604 TaxID=933084 RepID=A0A067QI83_9AGAM|nr:hypothetical protein JAAARDRAFT_75705 [Jaapia argillacea MUCL 33604]